MVTYRIEVGRDHGVQPKNIVGAIANEAGIDSAFIGHIKIHDEYSTVDLPEGMPSEVFNQLKKIWVSNRQLNISLVGAERPVRRKSQSDDRPVRRKEHSPDRPLRRKDPASAKSAASTGKPAKEKSFKKLTLQGKAKKSPDKAKRRKTES
jgi:ATP-dependent RNA helicase DeaD